MEGGPPILIEDRRSIQELKKETFSHFQKTDVKKWLETSIHTGNIPYSIHWACELLCSGLVDTLWNVFFECYLKFVNRKNPNLLAYLYHRYQEFLPLREAYLHNIPLIRNSKTARAIVCEAAILLSMFTNKSKLAAQPAIKPDNFTKESIQLSTKANSPHYSSRVLRPDDPPLITIPVNEFCYGLSTKDLGHSLYWMKWLIEFPRFSQAPIRISLRDVSDVDSKFVQDPVWILWECLQQYTPRHLEKFQEILFKLFREGYEKGTPKAKKHYLTFATMLCCDSIDVSTPICHDQLLLDSSKAYLPDILSEIAKHRLSSNDS
jgi:hypothetical protein